MSRTVQQQASRASNNLSSLRCASIGQIPVRALVEEKMLCGLSHIHYNASCHYNPNFSDAITCGWRLPVPVAECILGTCLANGLLG
jgi:hypothetical protein